jgi:hypothetical protein
MQGGFQFLIQWHPENQPRQIVPKYTDHQNLLQLGCNDSILRSWSYHGDLSLSSAAPRAVWQHLLQIILTHVSMSWRKMHKNQA